MNPQFQRPGELVPDSSVYETEEPADYYTHVGGVKVAMDPCAPRDDIGIVL